MKNIRLIKSQVEDVAGKMLDPSDPGYNDPSTVTNLRRTIWMTMLQPMVASQSANLEFISAFIKCKDAINEVLKTEEGEIVSIEDSDFKFLYDTFHSFVGWKTDFAHIIHLAGEVLKNANNGKI